MGTHQEEGWSESEVSSIKLILGEICGCVQSNEAVRNYFQAYKNSIYNDNFSMFHFDTFTLVRYIHLNV